MCRKRYDPGSEKGADDPECEDRPDRAPKPAQADVKPAVEEDHEERDDGDPLDVLDGEHALKVGPNSAMTAAPIRKMAA